MRAIWKESVIAESSDTVVVDGNHYFPRDSLLDDYFSESETVSTCAWKGKANYLNVTLDGEANRDAAWYYAEPKNAAESIRGRVAFWRGVKVVE